MACGRLTRELIRRGLVSLRQPTYNLGGGSSSSSSSSIDGIGRRTKTLKWSNAWPVWSGGRRKCSKSGNIRVGAQQKDTWVPHTASIDEPSRDIYEKLLLNFKKADSNNDGVLQKEELRRVLESVGNGDESIDMHWMTDDDLDAMMRQYDSDQDGVISFEEYKLLAEDNVFLNLALNEYKNAFEAIDQGKNGKIGPTELYRLFEKLDSPLQGYESVVALMEEYDLNGDGACLPSDDWLLA